MKKRDYEPEVPKTWPDHWWRSGRISAQLSHEFGDRIIVLGVAFTLDGEAHYEWFSGFLLKIDPMLFWLTAGHVIDHLLELRDAQFIRIDKVSWNDGYPNKEASVVPVSLDALPVYRDQNIDFGAILIRPGFAAPLLANQNVRPLTPETWYGLEKAKPEGYYIVGFPEVFANTRCIGGDRGREDYVASAPLVCLPMEPIERQVNGEPASFWEDPHALYGKLVPFSEGTTPENLANITGMSGGPVFSIERDPQGKLLYRLYGIQSVWLRTKRIIRAVPIRSVVEVIAKWFSAKSPDQG